ncbi:MAG: ankyrin repeat domain-containing protein [Rhizobiales bacterium]|nr:ankyrin repeat domain-containing protein [Hyphomicrobiales bacterium]
MQISESFQDKFFEAVFRGDVSSVRDALHGQEIAITCKRQELTALHIAVGTNNLPLARLLIEEWHVPFGPDGFGRWPTVVAAECCASEELCDYIVEKEAAAMTASK